MAKHRNHCLVGDGLLGFHRRSDGLEESKELEKGTFDMMRAIVVYHNVTMYITRPYIDSHRRLLRRDIIIAWSTGFE